MTSADPSVFPDRPLADAGPHPEDRQLSLLTALLAKTQAGRLVWAQTSESVSTTAAGSLYFQFTVAPALQPPYERHWVRFTVVRKGRELLRVDQAAAGEATVDISADAPVRSGSARQRAAVTALFRAACPPPSSDLDDTIATINRL